ncbi:MFS transporter [Acinetobacter baumannii]|uniref:MFS transporter n=1 Tax=Acinetobacter baumannii TaxID=470 RepID=A0A3R9TG87_ACIBA|nr:MFS transporter [Acinetobacter baumannii]
MVNTFLVVGSILGLFIVNKIGRRPLAIMSFMLLTFSTLYIAIGYSALWIIVAFSLFAMVSSGASVLDVVYPAELFPTEIRATATGVCVGISRLGAALGTFLVPIGISSFGTNAVMMVASLVCGVGLLICILYAPETRGLALDDAASVTDEDSSARKYHKIVNGDKYE